MRIVQLLVSLLTLCAAKNDRRSEPMSLKLPGGRHFTFVDSGASTCDAQEGDVFAEALKFCTSMQNDLQVPLEICANMITKNALEKMRKTRAKQVSKVSPSTPLP